MSDLEKQFDDISDELNAKIKEAADALKQVNELAKKHGLKVLHCNPYLGLSDYGVIDGDDRTLHSEVIDRLDFYPLLREMDNAGWNSSSFDC